MYNTNIRIDRGAALLILVAMSLVIVPAHAQSFLNLPTTQVAAGTSHSCIVTTTGNARCWGANNAGQLGNNSFLDSALPVTVGSGAVPLSGVVAVATGGGHSCAVTTTGQVKCWGSNTFGQLGNNDATFTNSAVPVTVVSAANVPLSGAVSITAGLAHACALLASGSVSCWGSNSNGEVGPPTTSPYSTTPAPVSAFNNAVENFAPITDVVAIAAGEYHTCALTTLGAVECWGDDSFGQLGDGEAGGNTLTAYGPYFAFIIGATAIAAGGTHSCAVTLGANTKCWGSNEFGELGNGGSGGLVPAAVLDSNYVPITGVVAVAAGQNHTCALSTSGGVRCWGDGTYGQLGTVSNGIQVTAITTVEENGAPLAGVTGIAAGATHTCALTANGEVRCWGRNQLGQLGQGLDDAIPQSVLGLTQGAPPISAGYYHTCARTSAGGVKCWGDNYGGQVGVPFPPVVVAAAVDVVDAGNAPVGGIAAVSAGYFHTCARTTANGAECWGSNYRGALGNNSALSSSAPVSVVDGSNVPLTGVAEVSAGRFATCVTTTSGNVKCWGANDYGQLGNNSFADSSTAVTVVDASNVPLSGVSAVSSNAISTYGNSSCALLANGGVRCWGANYSGQLGNNSASNSPTPVTVVDSANVPLTGMTAISVGVDFACALTATHGAKCWGSGYNGQLGNNSFGYSPFAVTVVDASNTPVSDLASIAAGGNHACAQTLAGGARCWGSNTFRQLGSSSLTDSSTPVTVVDGANVPLGGVTAISAGLYHTCAFTPAGAQCWGDNLIGQHGSGSANGSPGETRGLIGGVAQISLGVTHTCALTSDGGVLCWGANGSGQLGTNSTSRSTVPATVVDASDRPLGGLLEISAGAAHTCARNPDSSVICWGSNFNGQLGNNSAGGQSSTPVDVVDAANAALRNIASLSAGASHSCARTGLGGVMCWGANNYGQLGNNNKPNEADAAVPVVTSIANSSPIGSVAGLASGADHACVLTTGHGVKCWGDNEYGQLGTNSGGVAGATSPAPADVTGLSSGIAQVAAGDFFSCAVTSSNGVKCWGYNGNGQLGTNDIQLRLAPTDVTGLASGVMTVVAGSNHACALMTNGGMKCWGDNKSGQIGDNSTTQRKTPVDVSGLTSGVVAIGAGGNHTCALTTQNILKCWGANDNGQIGNNTTTNQPLAVKIQTGQSIAFAPRRSTGLGSFNLTATASSGLAVAYSTWTPSTCQVSGSTLTATAYGLCGVRASQAGGSDGLNGTFARAPQQLRIISISNEIFSNGFE
jgi:alpha-tubulin suppressor-like RCC1 family protein